MAGGECSWYVSTEKAETSGVTVAELRNLAPYELLLEEDGSYAYNVGSWNRLIAEDLNLQNLPYKDLSYNMLREVCNRKYTTETTRYRFNVGLNAKIWRELVFDTKFQYEKNVADTRQYDNEETDYVRQMVNYYTDYDLSGDVLKISTSLREALSAAAKIPTKTTFGETS